MTPLDCVAKGDPCLSFPTTTLNRGLLPIRVMWKCCNEFYCSFSGKSYASHLIGVSLWSFSFFMIFTICCHQFTVISGNTLCHPQLHAMLDPSHTSKLWFALTFWVRAALAYLRSADFEGSLLQLNINFEHKCEVEIYFEVWLSLGFYMGEEFNYTEMLLNFFWLMKCQEGFFFFNVVS